jgi:GMP synthase (glutamine-hydrolysing)
VPGVAQGPTLLAMKPLACLRHQANTSLGILEEVFDEQGVEWHYVDCWTGAELPDLSQTSGLVVLGGGMNVDETRAHPHLVAVKWLMRAATDSGLPVLGICLGAQLLARSLGAKVYRAPAREIGFVEIEATGKDLSILEPFAPPTRLFQWHEDTFTLPREAKLIFTGRAGGLQAFRVGDQAFGVQFHLEITTSLIAGWCEATPDLETAWDVTKKDLLEQAEEHLEDQQTAGREVARRFAKLLSD